LGVEGLVSIGLVGQLKAAGEIGMRRGWAGPGCCQLDTIPTCIHVVMKQSSLSSTPERCLDDCQSSLTAVDHSARCLPVILSTYAHGPAASEPLMALEKSSHCGALQTGVYLYHLTNNTTIHLTATTAQCMYTLPGTAQPCFKPARCTV